MFLWFVSAIALAGCQDNPLNSTTQVSETSPPTTAPASRSFNVTYTATVADLPPNTKRLDLWLPIPSSSNQQTIKDLTIDSPLPHETQTDATYGNRLLHVWSDSPAATRISITFDATRREESEGARQPAPNPRLLQADKLGVIDDRIRHISSQLTDAQPDVILQAQSLYTYVISHMAYDKITPGWGRGDTVRACDVGKGNCTDFHSLFISLARAATSPPSSKSASSCPPNPAAQFPATTAGHISGRQSAAGLPSMPPKPGSTRKSATITSVISTPTVWP